MTFRARLILAFLPLVLVPLTLFGWGVRRAVGDRLTALYEQRATQAAVRTRAELEGVRAVAGVGRAVAPPGLAPVPSDSDAAQLLVTQTLAPLKDIQTDIDRWLALGLIVTAGLALAVATWLAARLSRPLAELTRRAAELDLERPGAAFDTGARDEVGRLSRVLGAMTARLAEGAERARRAERRAALGDLARQVNHDIRNGLTPIRNVFRHWSDVAAARPSDLPTVFAERRGTVESSITYLGALAGEYARLAVPGAQEPCDLNLAVQGAALRLSADEGVTVRLELAEPAPVVRADPLALRRVIDNLATNAREALGDGRGTVTLKTEGGERVRLRIIDTGAGMSPADVERALAGFHSTKPQGSGLGLTIVRRLVGDAGGALRVDTAPGRGSSFTVEFPRREGGP